MPKTYLRFEPDDIYNVISNIPGAFFDKNSNFIISPSFSELRVFEYPSMRQHNVIYLKSDSPVVSSFLFSDSNVVSIAYRSGAVQFISLDSKEVISEFDLQSQVVFSQQLPGAGVYTTSNGSVYVLDLVNNEISVELDKTHIGYCTCACLFNQLIVTGGRDRVVNVVDRNREKVQVLTDFNGIPVGFLKFDSFLLVATDVGCFIYSFGHGQFALLQQLEVQTAEELRCLYQRGDSFYVVSDFTIQQFEVSAKVDPQRPAKALKSRNFYRSEYKIIRIDLNSGRHLLVSTNKNLLVVLSEAFEPISEIDNLGHRNPVLTLSLNDENTLLQSVSSDSLKIWNIKKSNPILTIPFPDNLTPSCSLFLPGNAYCLVGTKQGIVLLMNLLSGNVERMTQVAESGVNYMELHKNMLFTAAGDCKIKFLTFTPGFDLVEEEQYEFPLPIVTALITEKYVFAALSDNSIRIHFSDSLKYKFTLYGHSLPVSQMLLSPTGEKLFTVARDKTIRAWGLNFGECLKIIKLDSGCSCFELLAESDQAIVGCDDGNLRYFDLDNYQLVAELHEGNHGSDYSKGHFGAINCLVAGKEGKFAISTASDCRIHLWIESSDLVAADDEFEKRMLKEAEKEMAGRHEWEGEKEVKLDKMDILEETIAVCSNPEEHKLELSNSKVEDYLLDTIMVEIQKEDLCVLIENLTFENAILLTELVLRCKESEFCVFVLIRLWRNQLIRNINNERVMHLKEKIILYGKELISNNLDILDAVAGELEMNE